VITLGRGSQRDIQNGNQSSGVVNSKSETPVFEVERGGYATYHGPGQLVIYPIVKILNTKNQNPFFNGVHGLIRSLETIVSMYLFQKYNLKAGPVSEKTGVWIESQRKIASIGISAKRWVSYHGCAINLDTGPDVWMTINPCGFESSVMTDILRESGRKVSFAEASSEIQEFFETFISVPVKKSILPWVGDRIL
jgi:lipoate-protein ligase B